MDPTQRDIPHRDLSRPILRGRGRGVETGVPVGMLSDWPQGENVHVSGGVCMYYYVCICVLLCVCMYVIMFVCRWCRW